MDSCTHNVSAVNSTGVYECDCGSVRYSTCAVCSRVIEPDIFPNHFSTPPFAYYLACSLCKDTLCPDCANSHLHPDSKQCFKCRSANNRAYNDEAASGWVVTYHCSYIDRNGRTCNNVFLNPQLFQTRTVALTRCVDYVHVALASLVDRELVTRICEELEGRLTLPEVQDLLDQNPGFQVKCSMSIPAGPSLTVLIVAKTLRSHQPPFE